MIRIRSGDAVTELAWTGENIPAARLLAQAGLYPDYPCGRAGPLRQVPACWPTATLSPAAPEELAQLPPRELAGVCALPALPGSAAPTRS